MKSNITFPEDLNEFLYWVKITTEAAWIKVAPDDPMYGARWLGLSDPEIERLELKYAIKFGSEHRAFLKILHTIDKKDEEAETAGDEPPAFFYNWITDNSWIERRLNWPYDTILQDVLGVNRFWLKSWGERPGSDAERTEVFSAWYYKAPRLLPITTHTFLMEEMGAGFKPVLSVWGADTIVVAWSLRHYLMRTFARELDLQEIGIPELDALETLRLKDVDIPYWKEVITYWPSRWQGFR